MLNIDSFSTARGATHVEMPPAAPPKSTAPKTILVIDDEEWLREMVKMALTQRGFEVLDAPSGAVGVKIARDHLPDLILCDVNMPELDGYQTLSELRNESETASIPFILMTGLADNDGMRHGMELGADDYLPKPFKLEQLYAAVDARLKKVQVVRQDAEKKLADLRDNISLMLPHELRTPLNGILAYGELLATAPETMSHQELAEAGNAIRDSGQRLQHLVENFLIYAQLELLSADPAKIATLRQSRTSNAALVVQQHARSQAAQATREADLSWELVDGPLAISEDYLGKIVDEIVQNGFKFSDPETVVRIDSQVSGQWMSLSVVNHGRGFSTEHIRKVGAYMQFERKLHEQQGVGLGLTIAKRLAELHGGTLTIDSKRGATTTVTVKLPRAE